MTNTTERDWRKELATPGMARDKEYITEDNKKAVCYTDFRLYGIQKDFPINMIVNGSTYPYSQLGEVLGCYTSAHNIVGPWIEPVVKQKVKRVKLYFMSELGNYLFETHWSESVEAALKEYGRTKDRLVTEEWREFEEPA